MWSCLIDGDKANPQGLETQREGDCFRVKIRPDGVSDWITHISNGCPVSSDVKVSVRFEEDFGNISDVRADMVDWWKVAMFRVHGTHEPAEQPKGRYMVSVGGFGTPTKEHDSVDDAIKEAQRLGAHASNVKSTVRILQVVATLPPVGARQVVMAGEAA